MNLYILNAQAINNITLSGISSFPNQRNTINIPQYLISVDR